MEPKMRSCKVVWDTMFTPNPLFDILTIATCKPTIRNSSISSDYKLQTRATCNNKGYTK